MSRAGPWSSAGLRLPRVNPAVEDGVFLALVTLLSLVLYVSRLGFYSDDWAFLGLLANGPDQSVAGLSERQYEGSPNLKQRPTQIVEQAVLYRLFGLDPLGYHLVHSAILVAGAVLLFLVLHELRLPRIVAVTVPAVYALLPHYSTDRFWFAAFGYALSMALAFLSVYADLRALRSGGGRFAGWKVVALAGIAAASFGYEIVMPLLAAVPLLVLIRARRLFPGGLVGRLGGAGAAAFLMSDLAVLALVAAFKVSTSEGGLFGTLTYHIAQLVFGTSVISFGSYGVGLPYAAWWGLRNVEPAGLAVGALVAAIVFWHMLRTLRAQAFPGRQAWLGLALGGVAVYALGYAIFLTTTRILYTSTGIANRVMIAGTLGVAMLFVALIGLAVTLLRREKMRRWAFATAVAAVCLSGFLVVNALARDWVEAWDEQREVLGEIRTAFPMLRPGDTLLLHGVCPYKGPAIVFESNWDLAGALQVRYREPSLRADVTTSELAIGRRGISTVLYGVIPAYYPFRKRILLFDRPRLAVRRLRNAEEARAQIPPERRRFCPKGEAGKGVEIFAFDRVYDKLEARGFRFWP